MDGGGCTGSDEDVVSCGAVEGGTFSETHSSGESGRSKLLKAGSGDSDGEGSSGEGRRSELLSAGSGEINGDGRACPGDALGKASESGVNAECAARRRLGAGSGGASLDEIVGGNRVIPFSTVTLFVCGDGPAN